ncbi:MAG: hypothetical protein IMZ62_17285 [Chloroflexi bacterium]|nr:hypothetical protein [Chloroflexota bacterium]
MTTKRSCPGCGAPYSPSGSHNNDRTQWECESYETPDDPPEFQPSYSCVSEQLRQAMGQIATLEYLLDTDSRAGPTSSPGARWMLRRDNHV